MHLAANLSRALSLGVSIAVWAWAIAAPAAAQNDAASNPMPQWRFQAGDEHHWRLVHRIDAVQDLGAGGEVKYGLEVKIWATWRVEEAHDDGSALIRQLIRRIVLQVHGPGEQSMNYDSEEKEAPRGFAARVAPLMEALRDAPLLATISSRGAVTDVVVPDELQDQLRTAPGAKKLGDLATVATFENLLRQSSIAFPKSEALEPGHEWSDATEVKVPLLGTLSAKRSYRYQQEREVDGRSFAVFQPTVTMEVSGDPESPAPHAQLTRQDSSGEILFDRTAGRLESTTVKQSFQLTFTLDEVTVNQQIEQVVESRWTNKE